MENPGGPDDGKSWYVRRIVGAAGGPESRWYNIEWAHPQDPCAGMLPGDEGYREFVYDPEVHELP